jgi:hypothetical protein
MFYLLFEEPGRVASRTAEDSMFQSRRNKIFTSPQHPDRISCKWVPEAVSPRVKRPELETDHSTSFAEVNNTWNYTATTPCLHGIMLNELNTGIALSLPCV